MGTSYGGTSRRPGTPTLAARLVRDFRRSLTAGGSALSAPGRRGPVSFSPLAGALAELKRIQIAAEGQPSSVGAVRAQPSAALIVDRDVMAAPVGRSLIASRSMPFAAVRDGQSIADRRRSRGDLRPT